MEYLLAADVTLFLALNNLEWGMFGVVFFQTITLMGNLPGVVILLLVCMGIHGQGRSRMAAALVATMLLSVGVNAVLKVTVQRPRPLIHFTSTPTKTFAPPPEPGWGRERSHGPMQLRTRPLTKRSFPSGHAQYAFTWMVFMALLLPQGAIPFVTLACLVALSRVVLGVHFPLDVVVGALCGTAFGWIGFTVGSAWERRANPDCDPSDGDDACGVA